jgi:membrane fusion protein, heavy metal efflux system
MMRVVVIALIVIAAGAGGYVVRGRIAEPQVAVAPPAPAKRSDALSFPEGAPQLSAVKVDPAIMAPLPIAEPLNGRISYNEEVTARISSPIAGRVISLKAQAGDEVKAGATLAIIDAPDLAAAVADTRKAEADEARKKLSFERAQKLFEAEVVPRKDLETAQADLAQANAETQRARLRLRNLSPGGSGTPGGFVLRAPLGGVVADRRVNPSMEVQPGMADPLFVVSDLSKLWVMIDLPERYLGSVAPGLPVSLTVEAFPKERFRGTVTRVGQVVNAETRRVQVRCDVANADKRLKPEMYARVSLLTDEGKQTVRLPVSALVTEGVYSFVFVETQPRTFTRRKVTLALQDREYAYIETGVTRAEKVVIGGALLLQSELRAGQ